MSTAGMHPLVRLAKKSIEEFLATGKKMSPPSPLTEEMRQQAGVFVSIKREGQLRGCIGTFEPVQNNVASEVIQNAISAATQDPRFPPVTAGELPHLTYSVDVLSAPERIRSKEELDPARFGVLVRSGERKGLLLPDLEGVNTADEQIHIAAMKAGIDDKEPFELFRFTVRRHS